jgi:hypothetical protein
MLRESFIGSLILVGEEIETDFSNDRANAGIVALVNSLIEIADI